MMKTICAMISCLLLATTAAASEWRLEGKIAGGGECANGQGGALLDFESAPERIGEIQGFLAFRGKCGGVQILAMLPLYGATLEREQGSEAFKKMELVYTGNAQVGKSKEPVTVKIRGINRNGEVRGEASLETEHRSFAAGSFSGAIARIGY